MFDSRMFFVFYFLFLVYFSSMNFCFFGFFLFSSFVILPRDSSVGVLDGIWESVYGNT